VGVNTRTTSNEHHHRGCVRCAQEKWNRSEQTEVDESTQLLTAELQDAIGKLFMGLRISENWESVKN
jgi:hypothetical protein